MVDTDLSCICFIVQSVHHREHDVQFFSIKVLLPIKKKNGWYWSISAVCLVDLWKGCNSI